MNMYTLSEWNAGTLCLGDIEIPVINLPEGYRSYERNQLISGVCKTCTSADYSVEKQV